MPRALRISEAAAMGLHAMALLATAPARSLSTRTIAGSFDVSEAHLSKVLQRLVKVGLLRSARGPRGGFSLARKSDAITLLEVFEAIEGPIDPPACMFGMDDCTGQDCILGRVLVDANQMLHDHLKRTTLENVNGVFSGRGFMDSLGK